MLVVLVMTAVSKTTLSSRDVLVLHVQVVRPIERMTAMMVELTRNPMKSIHAIRSRVKKRYGFSDGHNSSDSRINRSGDLSKRGDTMRSIGQSSDSSNAVYHEERCARAGV